MRKIIKLEAVIDTEGEGLKEVVKTLPIIVTMGEGHYKLSVEDYDDCGNA